MNVKPFLKGFVKASGKAIFALELISAVSSVITNNDQAKKIDDLIKRVTELENK